MARAAGPDGSPMVPHRVILDEILEFQDPDAILREIGVERFKTGTPESLMWSSTITAAGSGEDEFANLAMMNLQISMLEKKFKLMQLQAGLAQANAQAQQQGGGGVGPPGGGGGGPPGGGGQGVPGIDNAVLPREMLGLNEKTDGAAQAEGARARSQPDTDNRLREIGLEPARS